MTHPNDRSAKSGHGISRRGFLGRAGAAAAAPWIIPASARGADGHVAPSNRITLGHIGHGIVARGHVNRVAYEPGVQVLAICDVDRSRAEDGKVEADGIQGNEAAGGCTIYNDCRELLARDDIDAVLVLTPDHWHSPQSIHAAQAGKDVYCEKPVSVTIAEGRQMVEAVQRYGRVFQNGSQYRTNPTIRRVCEFVRAGGLGKVKAVYTIWGGDPTDTYLAGEPVPEGLDWDLWVGPAQWRPYNRAYHRNPIPGVVPWSFCEDFGLAASTGYHSHASDVLQYALGYEESGPVALIHPSSGEFPTLTYRYANGTLFHCVQNWDMVKNLYHAVPDDARLEGAFGGVIVGERGWVTSMSAGGKIEGGPASLMEEMAAADLPVTVPGGDHHGNWMECIRTRGKTTSHEEIGHRAAALGQLTIIANKLGRSLKWDPVKEEFPDDDQASRLLRRARRAPWSLTL